MLGPVVRTRYEAVRWIAREILLALSFTLPATLGAVTWWCGGDFSGKIEERTFLWFALCFAAVATLVYTPMVEVRRIKLLRELSDARDRLDRLAHCDVLTDLFNRRGFERAAAKYASRGAPVAAMLCDLDRFKDVNDRLGHGFGDEALRRVADCLRTVLDGPGVVIGRLGGEEFGALLYGVDRQLVAELAERVRARLAGEPVRWNGMGASVTMSIGLAFGEGADFTSLLARADAALYEAKRRGRDRISIAARAAGQAA